MRQSPTLFRQKLGPLAPTGRRPTLQNRRVAQQQPDEKEDYHMNSRRRSYRAMQFRGRRQQPPAVLLAAIRVGAAATGAAAVGAGAVGALAVGRLVIGRAAVRRLKIEDLEVTRLHVHELRVNQQPANRPASDVVGPFDVTPARILASTGQPAVWPASIRCPSGSRM